MESDETREKRYAERENRGVMALTGFRGVCRTVGGGGVSGE